MKIGKQLSGFWRQVLTLSSGTVLAQLLVLAATPVLTRLYEPEAFALLGAYLGATLVLTVIANGGYELAIMLPGEEGDAHRLFQLCVLLSLLAAGAMALLGALGATWLLEQVKLPELLGWHYLLPLSMLMEGVGQALYQLLNRRQAYRLLAGSRLARALAQLLLSLSWGFWSGDFQGLLAGLLAGQGAGLAFLLWGYAQKVEKTPFVLSAIFHSARQYRDFPLFAVLSNGLNTAGKQLPFFFLPALFPLNSLGKTMSGHFQQTQKLLSLPIGWLGVSLGSVFYEKASKAEKEGGEALWQLSWRMARTLFLLGLGPSLVVMLFGPQLFGWVLGEAWTEAGYYARWLMPWFFLTFMAVPLSYLVDVKRKLGIYLLFNLLLFVGQLLALNGGASLGQHGIIQLYGLVSGLLVLAQLAYFIFLAYDSARKSRAEKA
jgi:O-antigen/teichoic acid export membrane protein